MIFWPWYTFKAITFIRDRLHKTMRVFEYGCGSSTIFYAQRCGQVIAVDHNHEWIQKVIREAKTDGKVEITHVEPDGMDEWMRKYHAELHFDNAHPNNYFSKGWKAYFRKYVRWIDRYPNESFDVISIDGAARPSEMKHAIPKLAPGGMLILDNSERPRYAQGVALAPSGWHRHDFPGTGSVNSWRQATEGETRTKKWQTTVWIKPNAA